jgi:MFS family permease
VKGVVVMATVWSLATIACGFAGSYRSLLVTRGFIGLGEAGYGPAAGAILSSVFPARMRATIIGGFLAAASFGSVLGVILGGVISARWGWKAAFGVVGFPGLVLALLYMFVRDYKAPELAVEVRTTTLHRARGIAAELFRARSGVAAYFAGALQLITTSTILAWLPSFFNRVYGVLPDRAGIWAAAIIICATAGVVFWSIVADRLAQRDIRWRMLMPAACCLATLAIFATAFGALAPGPLQIGVIALGAFLMGCTTGPIPAVAIDVVHPALRSTAGSMVATVQNLFGLGIGPLLAGALSDLFGLQTAMAIMPISCGFAALLLLFGSRSYAADRVAVANLIVSADDVVAVHATA